MIIIKRFFISSSIIILFFSNAFAQQEDAFDKDIKKFLNINGSKETFPLVIDQMINQMKVPFSAVPEEYWDKLRKELNTTAVDELFDKLIPTYKKHFTHKEIKKVIKFYESPIGKKFARETPQVTQESMMIGQEWGKMIGEKIMKSLNEKGYKL